jgi:hypothetical protein
VCGLFVEQPDGANDADGANEYVMITISCVLPPAASVDAI